MLQKQIAVAAARKAAEVYRSSGAKQRIEQDGYTRVDPFKIADSEGVAVLLRPLKKLLGAFLRQESPGILINAERSAGLIHMTCAHELGHFFFGHQNTADQTLDYGPNSSRQELEADWFAYQILAPRLLIAQILRRKQWSIESLRNPGTLYQFSLRLGISYTAAAWSLYRSGLIDFTSAQDLAQVTPANIKRSIVGDQLENPKAEVWVLDENDKLSVLEPRPDDQLIIRLKSHASAGYLWSSDDAKGEGFTIEPMLIASTDPNQNLSQLEIGGQPTIDYQVSQKPTIQFEIPNGLNLSERQPWNLREPAYATYNSRTLFETLNTGLTQATKQRVMQERLEN